MKTGLTVKWWHLADVNSGLGQGWYHSEVTWGLTGWESVALSRPPLPSACWADCFERSGWRWWLAAGSGAERHWKRKRDPQWEKQFFGGRVCFNAGLSCAAVLVHCYWQHWSLERSLALSRRALERPCLTLLHAAEHTTAALVVPTMKFSSSHFWIGEQQTGSPTACLDYPAACRGRAARSLPRPALQPCFWAVLLVCPPGCTRLSGFHLQ